MAKKKQFSFDPITSDKPEAITAESNDSLVDQETFWLSPTKITDIQDSPLTDYESERLNVCEKIISEGKQVFIEVATALLEINQNKLYRASHKTFEEYCQQKFQFSRSRAYQLMDMAEVAKTLGPDTDQTSREKETDGQSNQTSNQLPETPSHFTALKEVDPQKRKEVWDEVVRESRETGKSITAKQIDKTNERLTGKTERNKPATKTKDDKQNEEDFSDHQLDLMPKAIRSSDSPTPVSELLNLPEQEQQSKPEEESQKQPVLHTSDDAPNQSQLIEQIRGVIKNAKDHQILLTISGNFIISNGLINTWCLLRNIPVEEIDDSFSDLITYEQAHEYGLV